MPKNRGKIGFPMPTAKKTISNSCSTPQKTYNYRKILYTLSGCTFTGPLPFFEIGTNVSKTI